MRAYPRNSPQAAARLVALLALADGHLCEAERRALPVERLAAELGLAPGAFEPVVQSLCEDLMAWCPSFWGSADAIPREALEAVVREVDDPLLRRKVLRLGLDAAFADRRLTRGEAAVLEAISAVWLETSLGLDRDGRRAA